ncbi:MAG TPA: 50S ribosomal protein L18 [Fibrobacteres bacterium]|jgi:large subunit ribosomal protein L18|nr:50S ribosomal protein L18 [Fibrobacterota bacterium]
MFADKSQIRRRTRKARHERIRKNLAGTPDRPRLCVRRSLNHIYAQIIDDQNGRSLLQITSQSPEVRKLAAEKAKTDISKEVGRLLAVQALEKGIKDVVFDRGGYSYHGRVKAVAEAAREAGLNF